MEEKDDHVAGFICINKVEPAEYQGVNWRYEREVIVTHRMAVSSLYRNSGIGQKLMNHAEELGKANGITYFKTDTYSMNKKAQELFKRCGYQYVGDIKFRSLDHPFYCYEKSLP